MITGVLVICLGQHTLLSAQPVMPAAFCQAQCLFMQTDAAHDGFMTEMLHEVCFSCRTTLCQFYTCLCSMGGAAAALSVTAGQSNARLPPRSAAMSNQGQAAFAQSSHAQPT